VTSLAEAAQGYLGIRRALGAQLSDVGRLLEDFVAWMEVRGQSTVTIATAVDWAAGPAGASPRTVATRLSAVRGFAVYLSAFDPATQIPPGHLVHVGVVRRVPFVFSDVQIETLVAAARTTLTPSLRAAGMATLIGVMAATGLRTAEARALDRGDVDPDGGQLLIRHSKYGATRQVPLHASTVAALTDYLSVRDTLCPDPVSEALLLSTTGRRLSDQAATFRRLLADTGIIAPPGRRSPRLHDLRHSFAVATVRDWHAAGVDVQRRLPVLSTYLGHLNPAHTYWYLQAVPELMAVLANRLDPSPAVKS
jgi:integrase/recombinase XerD